MNLHKLAKIVSIILVALGAVFFFINETVTIEKNSDQNTGVVTGYILVGYIAFIIALIAVIYFTIKGTLQDKAGLKKTLVSVGLLISAFIIGLIFAESKEFVKNGEVIVSPGASKMIGAFLNMFYIIAITSVGSLLWAAFYKIKK